MQTDKQAIVTQENATSSSGEPKVERLSRKDEKRLEAEFRKQTKGLRDQISSAEKRMQQLDEKLTKIDAELSDSAIYNDDNKQRLLTLLAEKAEHEKNKEDAEMLWFEAQEALELAQQVFEESLTS